MLAPSWYSAFLASLGLGWAFLLAPPFWTFALWVLLLVARFARHSRTRCIAFFFSRASFVSFLFRSRNVRLHTRSYPLPFSCARSLLLLGMLGHAHTPWIFSWVHASRSCSRVPSPSSSPRVVASRCIFPPLSRPGLVFIFLGRSSMAVGHGCQFFFGGGGGRVCKRGTFTLVGLVELRLGLLFSEGCVCLFGWVGLCVSSTFSVPLWFGIPHTFLIGGGIGVEALVAFCPSFSAIFCHHLFVGRV